MLFYLWYKRGFEGMQIKPQGGWERSFMWLNNTWIKISMDPRRWKIVHMANCANYRYMSQINSVDYIMKTGYSDPAWRLWKQICKKKKKEILCKAFESRLTVVHNYQRLTIYIVYRFSWLHGWNMVSTEVMIAKVQGAQIIKPQI